MHDFAQFAPLSPQPMKIFHSAPIRKKLMRPCRRKPHPGIVDAIEQAQLSCQKPAPTAQFAHIAAVLPEFRR
jgi:hypothetical protein